MKKIILISLITLVSCSHQKNYQLSDVKITGPKEVSIQTDSRGAPWLSEIEIHLKKKGFNVKRNAIVGTRTDKAEDHNMTYAQASTRFILRIDGSTNAAMRCFGGGFTFNYLSVELYDAIENKSLVSVSDSGYSEGCGPAYSTMFENVAEQVSLAWEK